MGEICASGSVGGEGGNVLAYPATYTAMIREKAQAAPTARPKVPMRRLGAHCLVVVMKRGNARGAKGVGHQRWIGSTGNGTNPRAAALTRWHEPYESRGSRTESVRGSG